MYVENKPEFKLETSLYLNPSGEYKHGSEMINNLAVDI